MLPEIYSFAGCPVLGKLSYESRDQAVNYCEACGQGEPEIDVLEYEFDGWDGEDIVTAGRSYAVTMRLGDALVAARLSGFELRPMKARKSSLFAALSPDPAVELPEFRELRIVARAKGGGWWKPAGTCPECGRRLWEHTDRVGEGLMAAVMGRVGPPREVEGASWDGSDLFWLDDPGPPLLTKQAVRVFEALKVKGVSFHPARWV